MTMPPNGRSNPFSYPPCRGLKRIRMGFDIFAAVGLIGTAVLIVAYFANQHGSLPAEDWRFPAANLAGSLLIAVSLYTAWNLPSAVIEAFWAAISVYGLARRRKR